MKIIFKSVLYGTSCKACRNMPLKHKKIPIFASKEFLLFTRTKRTLVLYNENNFRTVDLFHVATVNVFSLVNKMMLISLGELF